MSQSGRTGGSMLQHIVGFCTLLVVALSSAPTEASRVPLAQAATLKETTAEIKRFHQTPPADMEPCTYYRALRGMATKFYEASHDLFSELQVLDFRVSSELLHAEIGTEEHKKLAEEQDQVRRLLALIINWNSEVSMYSLHVSLEIQCSN